MIESGFDGVVAETCVGVLMPAGTPADIVARTEAVLNEATSSGVLTGGQGDRVCRGRVIHVAARASVSD